MTKHILFIIHQYVDANNFEKIVLANTEKEAQDILEKAHGCANKLKVKLQTLGMQYGLLKMNEGKSVADYFTRLLTVTNYMKTNGEQLTTLMIVEIKAMRTLTPRFDDILVAIEQAKDLEEMQVQELQGALEAQEIRMDERNIERFNTEQALQAQASKKNDGGSNKNKKGKGKQRNNKWTNTRVGQSSAMDQNHNESKINRNGCHDRYSMKNFNKKGIQCYNCQKWGHFGDECRSKRLQDKKNEAHNLHMMKILIQNMSC